MSFNVADVIATAKKVAKKAGADRFVSSNGRAFVVTKDQPKAPNSFWAVTPQGEVVPFEWDATGQPTEIV